MSRFVLQPARILQTRFVPDRTKEAVEWTFQELRANLVPTDDLDETRKLGMLRRGCFVGTSRHSKIAGRKNVFILIAKNGIGDIEAVLQADPSFQDRVESIYRVDEAEYDGRVVLLSGSAQTAP